MNCHTQKLAYPVSNRESPQMYTVQFPGFDIYAHFGIIPQS